MSEILSYLDDFRGVVLKIGVRTTIIEDAGGNRKIVNNSDIRNLQNRSQSPSVALCDLPIAYEQDLIQAEKVISDSFPGFHEKYPEIFPENPIYLGVQRFEASSMILRIAAHVSESDIFSAQRLMNREFKLLFDQNGIGIPIPQVVVHSSENA